jgi:hypothetical protein
MRWCYTVTTSIQLTVKHHLYTGLVRPVARLVIWTVGPLSILPAIYHFTTDGVACAYIAIYLLAVMAIGVKHLARYVRKVATSSEKAKIIAENLLVLLPCSAVLLGTLAFRPDLILAIFLCALAILVLGKWRGVNTASPSYKQLLPNARELLVWAPIAVVIVVITLAEPQCHTYIWPLALCASIGFLIKHFLDGRKSVSIGKQVVELAAPR